MFTDKSTVLLSTGHSTVDDIQFSPSPLSEYGECDRKVFTFNRWTGQYFSISTPFSYEREKLSCRGYL